MQHRVLEVMDNADGTLSIFGTTFDNASPTPIPPAGHAPLPSTWTRWPPSTARSPTTTRSWAAAPARALAEDQNVELLLPRPAAAARRGRRASAHLPHPPPARARAWAR